MKFIWLISLLLVSHWVQADPTLEDYRKYTRQYKSLVKKMQPQQTLPKLDSIEGNKVITYLTDEKQLTIFDNFPINNIIIAEKTCQTSADFAQAYLSHRDVQSYPQEIALFEAFSVQCMAKVIPLVETYLTTVALDDSTQINWVKEGNQSKLQLYLDAFAALKKLNDKSAKKQIIDALHQSNRHYVRLMSPWDKSNAINQIQQARSNLLKEQFDQIIQEIEESPCKVMCKL